jgi:hypothetical protein
VIDIGKVAALENPETFLRICVRMKRAVLRKAFAERMVASGKNEEDEKSRQYIADWFTDRHLYNIPLHNPLQQRICRLILKGVTDFFRENVYFGQKPSHGHKHHDFLNCPF